MGRAVRPLTIALFVTFACATEGLAQDQVGAVTQFDSIPDTVTRERVSERVLRLLANDTTSGEQVPPDADTLAALLSDVSDSMGVRTQDPKFYCIIHLASWKNGMVTSQGWFLYRGGHGQRWSAGDISGQRLYGLSKVGLLYIHLGAPDSVVYRMVVTRKRPVPMRNLAGLFEVATKRTNVSPERAPKATSVKWGFGQFNIRYTTSDISIEGLSIRADVANPFAKQSFVNEGLTHWDVSVAVPVQSIKEVSYASQSNIVTANTITRQKAYAVFDLFPWAVDARSNRVQPVPIMFGVSMANRPFDHLLLAAGVRWQIVNVFAGFALNNDHKPKTLQAGDTATTGQLADDARRCHFTKDFTFGVNLSVTRVLQAGGLTN